MIIIEGTYAAIEIYCNYECSKSIGKIPGKHLLWSKSTGFRSATITKNQFSSAGQLPNISVKLLEHFLKNTY